MMKLNMVRELQAGDSVCRGAALQVLGATRLPHPVDDFVRPPEALQKKSFRPDRAVRNAH